MRLTAHSPVKSAVQGFRLSTPDNLEFREMTRTFAEVGAFPLGDGVVGRRLWRYAGAVNLTAGDHPLRVRWCVGRRHALRQCSG